MAKNKNDDDGSGNGNGDDVAGDVTIDVGL